MGASLRDRSMIRCGEKENQEGITHLLGRVSAALLRGFESTLQFVPFSVYLFELLLSGMKS
jgi:hypothetical protein